MVLAKQQCIDCELMNVTDCAYSWVKVNGEYSSDSLLKLYPYAAYAAVLAAVAAASSAATSERWMLAGPRERRLNPEPRGRPRDRPVPLFTVPAPDDATTGTVFTA